MFEIGSALDPGRKRSAGKNQDSLCVIQPAVSNHRPPLLVIADGMGGYEGGAIASQLVISSFTDIYQHANDTVPPFQTLEAGVSASLNAIKRYASQDQALAKMGSTVVAVLLREQKIYLINVGDSRAYVINEKQIRQISYDHSLVGEQLRRGLITADELRSHPRRNVLSMSISAQRENITTYTNVFTWQPGDSLLLCSDGLWGPVSEPQIQSVVLEYPPQQAADRLVSLANANQGPDNIAVVVAKWLN